MKITQAVLVGTDSMYIRNVTLCLMKEGINRIFEGCMDRSPWMPAGSLWGFEDEGEIVVREEMILID